MSTFTRKIGNLVLGSPLPGPKVKGKRRKRDVVISGLMLNDDNGNEIGGLGVLKDSRTALFALDYETHEAIVLYASQEHDSAGIKIHGKSDLDFRTMRREPTRSIELTVTGGEPVIQLRGKDGKPRIVLGLDGKDNPYIRLVDSRGRKRVLRP